jgi:hypothetical protein
MARRIIGNRTGTRLQLGAAVLAASRAADTRAVQARLANFERVHGDYVTAQGKVDAAEAELRVAQAHLAECDAVQDDAVERLACSLANDGHSRKNPFDGLGVPAPSVLKQLFFADEAQAVHQLVAALQRARNVSPASLELAKAADEAARTVEQALVPVATLQDAVKDARRMRDTLSQDWESALAILRLDARAAEREGAPGLYGKLFPTAVRKVAKRTPKEEAVAAPEPVQTPAPQPVQPAAAHPAQTPAA